MQTPSTLYIWLSEQVRPALLLLAILACVLFAVYLSLRARHARMNEAREGMSEATFVNSLVIYGFDSFILQTTYRYLRDTQRIGFPLQAADQLDEDLGLDLAGIDECVQDLLALSSRLYLPGRCYAPLVTVEDLVRFIQASPRVSELAA